ncbi:MAG TPA: Arc family DNA-binding protein [Vicinamibacterales bacterium]|nr:Arc family DNA-binding protein [Vicinamibacterales bacterium]
MPSLTLKDIPKRLHQQLRQRAERNRRSMSQEALACLEQVVSAEPVDADALLTRARALRAPVKPVRQRDLDTWVQQGRP